MKSKYEIFFYEVIISEFTAVWVEKVGDCHCCKLQVEREILFATSQPGFLWYSLYIFIRVYSYGTEAKSELGHPPNPSGLTHKWVIKPQIGPR